MVRVQCGADGNQVSAARRADGGKRMPPISPNDPRGSCLIYGLNDMCQVWLSRQDGEKVALIAIGIVVVILAIYIPWAIISTMAEARLMRDTLAANRQEVSRYNRSNEALFAAMQAGGYAAYAEEVNRQVKDCRRHKHYGRKYVRGNDCSECLKKINTLGDEEQHRVHWIA